MSGEQFVPFNAEELMRLESEAAQTLAVMTQGAIQGGTMPPKQVFDWYAMFNVENLIMLEAAVLLGDMKTEENEAALHDAVANVSATLKVASKQKMFVLQSDVEKRLQARKLRYPTTMDLTYGGLLP